MPPPGSMGVATSIRARAPLRISSGRHAGQERGELAEVRIVADDHRSRADRRRRGGSRSTARASEPTGETVLLDQRASRTPRDGGRPSRRRGPWGSTGSRRACGRSTSARRAMRAACRWPFGDSGRSASERVQACGVAGVRVAQEEQLDTVGARSHRRDHATAGAGGREGTRRPTGSGPRSRPWRGRRRPRRCS